MRIRFTHHAEKKFETLERHGVKISRAQAIEVLERPKLIDAETRKPLIITQASLDKRRELRVYKEENDTMVVITFYHGRKSQHER